MHSWHGLIAPEFVQTGICSGCGASVDDGISVSAVESAPITFLLQPALPAMVEAATFRKTKRHERRDLGSLKMGSLKSRHLRRMSARVCG